MASTLRLTGANGGNTIISANDTITADQTFEFPNTGGTLLTSSGETTNGGSGGSSGSGQVVGYQQGAWTPTLNQGTATFTNTNWWRIGNAVTVTFTATDFTETTNATGILVSSLPYNNNLNTACAGSCMYQHVTLDQVPKTVVYVNANSLSFYGGYTAAWRQMTYSQLSASSSMYAIANYLTEDTTWAPGSGATVS